MSEGKRMGRIMGFLPDGTAVRIDAQGYAHPVTVNIVPSQQTVAAVLKSVVDAGFQAHVEACKRTLAALPDVPWPKPPDDGVWLVTPADLRETRKGKGLGSGEVMGWGGYEDE